MLPAATKATATHSTTIVPTGVSQHAAACCCMLLHAACHLLLPRPCDIYTAPVPRACCDTACYHPSLPVCVLVGVSYTRTCLPLPCMGHGGSRPASPPLPLRRQRPNKYPAWLLDLRLATSPRLLPSLLPPSPCRLVLPDRTVVTSIHLHRSYHVLLPFLRPSWTL